LETELSDAHFQKLQRSLLQAKHNQRLVGDVAELIAQQVEIKPDGLDPDRLRQIPGEAQTVYWLWRFECEAGISGMDQFVLDWLGIYSAEIHSALKEVRANELVRLLEVAISLARDGPAEFRRLADQSWFNKFARKPEYPTLDTLNKPTFALMNGLTDLAANYIKSNERVFFQD
jgi:hypothetical protein